MKPAIRPIDVQDAAAIARIYRPIVESTTISFEELAPDAGEIAARIAGVTSTYPWLVAERDDEVVGYAYAGRHRERAGYRYFVVNALRSIVLRNRLRTGIRHPLSA